MKEKPPWSPGRPERLPAHVHFPRRPATEAINGYSDRNLAHKPDLVVIGNATAAATWRRIALDHVFRRLFAAGIAQGIFFIRGKRLIVVAGTHGKTTTTSLLTWVFEHNGLNPSYLIGGILNNLSQGARFTDSEWFIIEGDEYDTAFFITQQVRSLPPKSPSSTTWNLITPTFLKTLPRSKIVLAFVRLILRATPAARQWRRPKSRSAPERHALSREKIWPRRRFRRLRVQHPLRPDRD